MTASANTASLWAHYAVARAIIGALGLILAVAQLNGATSVIAPPAPLDNNEWFTGKVIELIRTETHAPEAKIEVTDRGKWHYQRLDETMRYWQIVRFKFSAHSPVTDQDIDTAGYVVFAYDPLTQKPELISVEDAAAAVKAGKAKDEPSPSPSP
jgi:hypothetical protein